jgi:hypothetical protein
VREICCFPTGEEGDERDREGRMSKACPPEGWIHAYIWTGLRALIPEMNFLTVARAAISSL